MDEMLWDMLHNMHNEPEPDIALSQFWILINELRNGDRYAT